MKKTLNLEIRTYSPETGRISLNILDSNNVRNQMVLQSLTATLVKSGTTEKFSGSLAQSWTSSDDNKKWNFILKKNIKTEDGVLLDAKTYTLNLMTNLKHLAKHNIMALNQLIGFNDFLENKTDTIKGLSFSETNNSVSFEFSTPCPDLLNYLRMIYFGYWKDFSRYTTSSGPYRISQATGDQSVANLKLEFRADSGYGDAEFTEVSVRYASVDESQSMAPSTIAIVPSSSPILNNDSIQTKLDDKSLLSAVVLNSKQGFFSSVKNRKIFQNKLIQFQKLELGAINNFYVTDKNQNALADLTPDSNYENTSSEVILSMGNKPSVQKLDFYKKLLSYCFASSSVSWKISEPSTAPNTQVSAENTAPSDLRILNVYNGSEPMNTVVEMMFCSNLGVGFPDPSKRMLGLVTDYKAKNNVIDAEYLNRFNEILRDDAAVLPLEHLYGRTYISKNIDINTMPLSETYPQFQLIRTSAQ